MDVNKHSNKLMYFIFQGFIEYIESMFLVQLKTWYNR